MVIDVSPYCNCHAENDVPIVLDADMFVSFDTVPLDVAYADVDTDNLPWKAVYLRKIELKLLIGKVRIKIYNKHIACRFNYKQYAYLVFTQ